MSEMSSFYGGRQGASFVIVKHFDGIDIPQPDAGGKYTYRGCYYAVDVYGNLELEGGAPIKRSPSKEKPGRNWKFFLNDGRSVVTAGGGTYTLDIEYAEGMVQCFKAGASTTDIVNYGEYVIIDTIVGLDSNSKDNGKVFRRGLDSSDFEYGGAEYIGQITGPQGDTPEVSFGHYSDIEGYSYPTKGIYTEANNDLVPGSYVDAAGDRKFNDNIEYIYAMMTNLDGTVSGCQIGFRLPTLVEDFEAELVSPYDTEVSKLITEDPSEFVDGKWQHPFYQKWKIKIPQGLHGVNAEDLEIVPTKTKPAYTTAGETFAGAAIYSDTALSVLEATSAASLDILGDADYDPSKPYAIVNYNGQRRYVKKEDCYKYIIRYKEINFDTDEQGTVTYHKLGDYNDIKKVTLSEEGILTAFYLSITPQDLEEPIRWIDNKNTRGIETDADGTLRFYFNTLDSNGDHEKVEYPTVLDWIEDVTLSQEGEFRVLYNNNTVTTDIDPVTGKSQYKATLKWIDYVETTDEGVVNFYYNTDHVNPITGLTTSKIKYIRDIKFNSKDTPAGLEGSGDQKFVITYNTKDASGNYETADNSSWAAMNYVIETKITSQSVVPNVEHGHLIVIYSDPAYRLARQSSWLKIPYPSDKLGVMYNQWIDLGRVKGETGGLVSVAEVSTERELSDDNVTNSIPIPPEYMLYALEQRKSGRRYYHVDGSTIGYNADYAGWCMRVVDPITKVQDIYFYDYSAKKWQWATSLDLSLTSPKTIIDTSLADVDKLPTDPTQDFLHEDGIWFAQEKTIFAM